MALQCSVLWCGEILHEGVTKEITWRDMIMFNLKLTYYLPCSLKLFYAKEQQQYTVCHVITENGCTPLYHSVIGVE
jgi:hypothetical protein